MAKLIAPVVPAGTMARVRQPDVSIDEELELRPWSSADATAVVEAFSDPDIQHWHFRRVDSEPDARDWITECSSGWPAEKSATWAIAVIATDEVLGRVSLYTDLEHGRGEVTYWVLYSHLSTDTLVRPVPGDSWMEAAARPITRP